MARRSVSLVDRFWLRIDRDGGPDSCWKWHGARDRAGYGSISKYNPDTKVCRLELAHRVSWELNFGEIPRGAWILHRCDNPSCVNPSHLFIGDAAENMRDKMSKGRHRNPVGEQCNRKKLTNGAVHEIRRLYPSSGVTQRELAKRFGVDQGMISKVVRRHNWRHLE